jgi:molybdopterin converting factor small subunit
MIIKIQVFLPAFISHDAVDPDGCVTLPAGACLPDLYRALRLPLHLRLSFLYTVNCEQARAGHVLRDGDVVSFIFPVPGG